MLPVTSTYVLAWERLTSLASAMKAFRLCSQMIKMVDFTESAIRQARSVMFAVVRGVRTCPGYDITGQAIVSGWARVGVGFGYTELGIVQCWLVGCCTYVEKCLKFET